MQRDFLAGEELLRQSQHASIAAHQHRVCRLRYRRSVASKPRCFHLQPQRDPVALTYPFRAHVFVLEGVAYLVRLPRPPPRILSVLILLSNPLIALSPHVHRYPYEDTPPQHGSQLPPLPPHYSQWASSALGRRLSVFVF